MIIKDNKTAIVNTKNGVQKVVNYHIRKVEEGEAYVLYNQLSSTYTLPLLYYGNISIPHLFY
jgi:hypothetical protein